MPYFILYMENVCKECSKTITSKYANLFCSSRCSAKYNNKFRIINDKQKNKTKNSVLCSYKKMTEQTKTIKRQKLLNAWQNEQTLNKRKAIFEQKRKILIEKAMSSDFSSLTVNWKKRVLFLKNGNQCEQCGYRYEDPISKKGPFEIHHKDGISSNWNEQNLIILCLICHWKTPNYRFRNRTHSEETRNKIRANQKKSAVLPLDDKGLNLFSRI